MGCCDEEDVGRRDPQRIPTAVRGPIGEQASIERHLRGGDSHHGCGTNTCLAIMLTGPMQPRPDILAFLGRTEQKHAQFKSTGIRACARILRSHQRLPGRRTLLRYQLGRRYHRARASPRQKPAIVHAVWARR